MMKLNDWKKKGKMKKELNEMTIEELKEAVETYKMREQALFKSIADRNAEIFDLRKRLGREGNRVSTLHGYERALCRKKAEVTRLKARVAEKDDIIRGYESRERCNGVIIGNLKSSINEKNEVIKDLTSELGALCFQKDGLKEQLQEEEDDSLLEDDFIDVLRDREEVEQIKGGVSIWLW